VPSHTGRPQPGPATPRPGTPASRPQATAGAARATRARDLGVVALVLLGPIWGYGWVASKVALEYSQPFAFAALRTVLSTLCLFLVMVVTRRSLRPPALGYTAVIGLLQTTAFVGFSVWALNTGGAGKVSVLTYTMPFWLLLLAWAFLQEHLRGIQWLAVALAFAGLVLVVAPWHLQGVASSVLALAGGFAWAASALVVKLLQRHRHVDILSLTTWQMALGSIPLVVIGIATYGGGTHWTAAFVGTLAYTVVLANGVAWVLWLYALRALSAGAAGLGTLSIPVMGVVAAWLQLGERPGVAEAAGMALIVVALAVLAARGVIASRRGAAGADESPAVQPVTD
jgi:drug/metabolite transporter (DMT)-like permease